MSRQAAVHASCAGRGSLQLKKLQLLGFKTFADKTEIEIGAGLTAIVGPNGSGKSNIVDALLWVDSYGAGAVPATAGMPRIVLGAACLAPGTDADVFIPVATPGINGSGHLVRVDGSVVLPLRPVRDDGLPSVADVIRRLDQVLAAHVAGIAA